jgi:predicted DNA-binding protein
MSRPRRLGESGGECMTPRDKLDQAIHLRLPLDLLVRLRAYAVAEGRSVSSVVRRALEQVLPPL